MRYYDLVETPQTGKTFLEDGTNRIPTTDSRVSVYFQSIDKVKYDRAFDDEGYPILLEYALKEDGTRYPFYLVEPDEEGVYQPDEEKILEAEQVEADRLLDLEEAERKLEGVLWEGVYLSATKEDMWGLDSAVKGLEMYGQSYNFQFDNGTVVHLTVDNYEDLMATWVPFRSSFF